MPDPIAWAGRYEKPETTAERCLRASHIGFVLAHQECFPDPDFVATLLLFRNMTDTRISSGDCSAHDIRQTAEQQTDRLGELGKTLFSLWSEAHSNDSTAGTISEDAYLLSEALSRQEQWFRGHATAHERLYEIEPLLKTPSAREMLLRIEESNPFRFWEEFSPELPMNSTVLDFLYETSQLRAENRTGWQRMGLLVESVAEHSLRAAQLAFIMTWVEQHFSPRGAPLKPYHAASCGTFHDVTEGRTGDPNLMVKSYVEVDELRAILDQTGKLGCIGAEIANRWKEVEEKSTVEGRIAKDADRLDMVFMARELVKEGIPAAAAWIHNTRPLVKTSVARALFEEVEKSNPHAWRQSDPGRAACPP